MYRTTNDKKERVAWLKARIETLEKSQVIKYYKIWKTLSEEEKAVKQMAWAKYYQQCAQSKAALRYRAIKDAWKRNDFATVHKLAEEAKQARASGILEIPMPGKFDPQSFTYEHFCEDYDNATQELDQLMSTVKFSPEEILV